MCVTYLYLTEFHASLYNISTLVKQEILITHNHPSQHFLIISVHRTNEELSLLVSTTTKILLEEIQLF